jgi:hypothetical protein
VNVIVVDNLCECQSITVLIFITHDTYLQFIHMVMVFVYQLHSLFIHKFIIEIYFVYTVNSGLSRVMVGGGHR